MPSSSQPKKQTHSLQRSLLGEDLVVFPTCEVGVQIIEGPIVKGPRMVLGYLYMASQPNLNALGQSWLHLSQWFVTINVFLCRKTSPLAQLIMSLSMDTVTIGNR